MNTALRTSLILCFAIYFFANLMSCTDGRFKQGKVLYEFHCASCHMEDGTGLAELYPPVNGSDYLMNNREKLPYIMRYGIEGPLTVNGLEFDIPMSGIPELSAVEISNITNYILSAWTNKLGTMSFEEVLESLNSNPAGINN